LRESKDKRRKLPVLAGYSGEIRRKRRFLRQLAIPVDFAHNMTLIAPVPTRAGVLFWSSAPHRHYRSPWRHARELHDLHRERSVGGVFYFCLGNDMSAIPLTVRGAERLQEELQRLKTVERPAVINAIAEARAQGDLSENAEYDAARERQGFIEGRIAELEGTLSNAHLIDPSALEAEGRAVFGATVEIEDLDSGDRVTYQIVGDVEADIKSNLISVSSPVARALIGKSEGDVVEVMAPAGVREYEVLGVRYI
jgi:transcription elongation factor GreA